MCFQVDYKERQVASQAPYRISEPKRDIVTAKFDELLQKDIIAISTSEYASPIVLIKKLIKKQSFSVSNIEEHLKGY